jgi:hypothetical protein
VLLGFQEPDIALLVAARVLAPLGKPVQNSQKYFAAVEVLALAGDRERLSQATRALAKHWQDKKKRRKSPQFRGDSSDLESAAAA